MQHFVFCLKGCNKTVQIEMNTIFYSNLQPFDRSQHFASWPCFTQHRHRPVLSFILPKKEMPYSYFGTADTSTASSQNQQDVTNNKATDKVQYLYYSFTYVYQQQTSLSIPALLTKTLAKLSVSPHNFKIIMKF
jgi:hypothetical protein